MNRDWSLACVCVYRSACDAKERQHWVNRLRATAEYHSELSANSVSAVVFYQLAHLTAALLPWGLCNSLLV